MRAWAVSLVVFCAGAVAVGAGATVASGVPGMSTCTRPVEFRPNAFPGEQVIDNRWLPLVPGTRLTLEGRANRGGGPLPHTVTFTVTDLTKVIAGVRTRVVWDVDVNEGELSETELAFFAQDRRRQRLEPRRVPGGVRGGALRRRPEHLDRRCGRRGGGTAHGEATRASARRGCRASHSTSTSWTARGYSPSAISSASRSAATARISAPTSGARSIRRAAIQTKFHAQRCGDRPGGRTGRPGGRDARPDECRPTQPRGAGDRTRGGAEARCARLFRQRDVWPHSARGGAAGGGVGTGAGTGISLRTSRIRRPVLTRDRAASPAPAFVAPIRAARYTAKVNHPLVPLTSVRSTAFRGREGDTSISVVSRVLRRTRRVAGVRVAIVKVREFEDGELVERTADYFAQDGKGRVWYFGERVDDIENGKVVGHEGQWLAGENGAKPGLFMPAKPRVGQVFEQERAPGVAEDRSRVVAVGLELTTPAGTFDDCIKTRDFAPARQGNRVQVLLRGSRDSCARSLLMGALTWSATSRRIRRRRPGPRRAARAGCMGRRAPDPLAGPGRRRDGGARRRDRSPSRSSGACCRAR